MELSRHYARMCRLRDFEDAEVAAAIESIHPGLSAARPHRKGWELAMTGLFLGDVGRLDGDARVLDLAAGTEPLIFWLANRVGHVTAADIYGRGTFAFREAAQTFLDDPAAYAPYEYPRDRVTAVEADARELPFADAAFDAVVCVSSIEHFGGPGGIRLAAAEIGRVLRPGGHALLVTEVFLRLSPLHSARLAGLVRRLTRGRVGGGLASGARPIDGFTVDELEELVIGPSGLRLMQPFDAEGDDLAQANVHRMGRDGTTTAAGGIYPHVVLGVGRTRWTSACLPLAKPFD